MAKKHISHILLILFIIALAAVPVAMLFVPSNAAKQRIALAHDTQLLAKLQQIELTITPTAAPTQESMSDITTAAPAKPNPTNTPTPTKAPKKAVYIASVVQSQTVSNWTLYKSGTLIGSSFSFIYPNTWNITYKSDDTVSTIYHFMFDIPDDKQVMSVQVYPYASSVESFIAAHYNNKLDSEAFGKIGNTTVYRLSPKATLSTNDPVYTDFGSRGLILGKKYAYTISFDSNPDHSTINLIEQIIWPKMSFK